MSEEVKKEVSLLTATLKVEVAEGPPLKTEPSDERPQSPEPNCAICLEEFNNRSCTNSCLHQFCFICLREWSKVKPECPLCKQRFQTIIHDIRSADEYEEYHVETEVQTCRRLLMSSSSQLPYSNAFDYRSELLALYRRAPLPHPSRSPFPSRLFSLLGEGGLLGSSSPPPPPPPAPAPPLLIPPRSSYDELGVNINFRRDVYRHNRWIRPFNSGRVRVSSPEFYRLNPAQTHRLVPWLYRELHVLLELSVDPNAVLIMEILSLITQYPIRSRQMMDALRPTLGTHTEHFLHEFHHFATSPHDIISYDLMAEYDPPSSGLRGLEEEAGGEEAGAARGGGDGSAAQLGTASRTTFARFPYSSDSDDSDLEVVQPQIPKFLSNRRLGGTSSSGGCLDLSSRAGPSSSRWLPYVHPFMDTGVVDITGGSPPRRGSGGAAAGGGSTSSTSGGPLERQRNGRPELVIEISDSSDSEVEIIHVRPPTPIVITIESTDSEAEITEVSDRNIFEPLIESLTDRCDVDDELTPMASPCDELDSPRSPSPPPLSPAATLSPPPHPVLRLRIPRPPQRTSKKKTHSSRKRSSSSTSSSSSSRSSSSLSSSSSSSDTSTSSVSSRHSGRMRRTRQRRRIISPPTSPKSTSSTQPSATDSDTDYNYGRKPISKRRKRKSTSSSRTQRKTKKRKTKSKETVATSSDEEYYVSCNNAPRLRSIVKRVKTSSRSNRKSKN